MAIESARPRRATARAVLAAVGMVGFAWLAGGFASFTWQATACVALGGVTVVVVAFRRAPLRHSEVNGPPPGISGWVIWGVAFLGWWGSAFLTGSRPSHPTLSLLLDPALELRPVKAVAFLAWLLGGWALVRR